MTSLPAPLPPATAAYDPSLSEHSLVTKKQDSRHDPGAGIDDRRGATRYITKDTLALIGWIDGGVGRKVTSALINISAGGALVETEFDTPPPPDTFVMIRLVSERTERVLRAKVVGVTTPRARGRFSFRKKQERLGSQVRLAFTESCPYEFFKASISGFLVEGMGVKSVSPRLDD